MSMMMVDRIEERPGIGMSPISGCWMLMVMSLITGFNGKVYLSHSIFEKVTQLDWGFGFPWERIKIKMAGVSNICPKFPVEFFRASVIGSSAAIRGNVQ